MSYHNAEANRLITDLLKVGTITEVSAGQMRAKIGDVTTHPIPSMRGRMGKTRDRNLPSVGEQVVIASPGGDMSQAFVMGGLPAENDLEDRGSDPATDLGGGTQFFENGNLVIIGGDVIVDGISFKQHVHGGVMPGGGTTGKPQ